MMDRLRGSSVCQIGVPQGGNGENGVEASILRYKDYQFSIIKERQEFPD